MTTPLTPTASTSAGTSEQSSLGWWESVSFTVTHAAASLVLAVLSPSGFYRFGRLFGTLEWMINYRRRRKFGRTLGRMLERKPTSAERRRITRAFFMRSRCDKLFYLTFDRMLEYDATNWFTIGNRHLLDDALARGRGAYVALAHQGDHHALGMLFAQYGYPAVGVRDGNESSLRRFVQERFARLYPDVPRPKILFADAFPHELFRVLQDGNVLMSLMDVSRVRAAHQKMQKVRIFGQQREFVTGPLRIAIRCKSPVFQAFFIAEQNFRYRFEIVDSLLDPDEVTDEETAVKQALTKYAANVERFLREHPEFVSRT